MALYLIPPGQRKGNKFYLVRGRIAGRKVEASAKTTDPTAAEIFKANLALELLGDRTPGAGEEIAFAACCDLYSAFRKPRKVDQQRLDKLKKSPLGKKPVRAIIHADIVKAANDLYPQCAAATKNRNAVRPIASVLHYGAKNGYCAWLRIETFKEKRPETRALSIEAARLLLANVPLAMGRDGTPLTRLPAKLGNRNTVPADLAVAQRLQKRRRLLLLWLFRQGNRISDALRIEWSKIDLRAGTVAYRVGKGDRDRVKPLHAEVIEQLAAMPEAERSGTLFPWRDRHGVYKWLTPYAKSLGIVFTPHMARHSVGKWLNESDASLRSIMDALDHLDIHSSARYQSTAVEIIRTAAERMPSLAALPKRRRAGGGK